MAVRTRLWDTIWRVESLPHRSIWGGGVWELWKIGGWWIATGLMLILAEARQENSLADSVY